MSKQQVFGRSRSLSRLARACVAALACLCVVSAFGAASAAAATPYDPTTLLTQPSEVVTEQATEVTAASAKLNGKLNPGGEANYYFEYGTSPCEAESCGAATAQAGPVTGDTQQVASPIEVTGLKSNTTYYYWMVAKNAAGAVHGTAGEFTTQVAKATQLLTEPATEVKASSAHLNGRLNPNGSARYYFEYGTSPCGAETCGAPTVEAGPLTGEAQQAASPIEVTGLKSNTTYHYWIVAANDAGAVRGAEATFTTPKSLVEVEAEEEARKQQEGEAVYTAAKKRLEEEVLAAIAKQKQEETAPSGSVSLAIAIVKVKVTASGVTVTVRASTEGEATISGPGLKRTTRSVAGGAHQLEVPLTKAGKAGRKHHRKIKLTVGLSAAGGTVSSSTPIKL
jgi:hypothetical protein